MEADFEISFYDQFSASIEIEGVWTLKHFAEYIVTELVGFDFDHAFGFYDNLKNPYRSKKKYSIFADLGDPEDEEDKGVETILVSDVFKRKGTRMVLLFDYGDDWIFQIRCLGIKKSKHEKMKAGVYREEGTRPVQYPVYDE